ncbi:CvpA family protein [Patescibacteria group bacterium]|nr:CvpA family protein [Patescibacteria group bacterium]MBU1722016.1 CvpA family protein [Patescibacteria group bacterium]MBU1901234.1 CvpA family protein [Patescibacteria group bacterium]
MPVFDLILIAIAALLIGLGVKRGFLYGVVSLVGAILGVLLASWYFDTVALWLVERYEWAANLSRFVVFVIAFLLIMIGVSLVFKVLKMLSRWFNRIPLLGWTNRLLGGVFGVLQAIVLIGMCVYILERYPISDGVTAAMATSYLAPIFSASVAWLVPFIPDAISAVQTSVEYSKEVIEST